MPRHVEARHVKVGSGAVGHGSVRLAGWVRLGKAWFGVFSNVRVWFGRQG